MRPEAYILAPASDQGLERAKAEFRRDAAKTVGTGPVGAGKTTRGRFP